MSTDTGGTSLDKFNKLMRDLVQVPKAEVKAAEKRKRRAAAKKKPSPKRRKD